MREVRIVLCYVTYDETVIALTDCDNRELQQICDIVYRNNESGIGKYYSDVCEDLYPDNIFYQIADTGETKLIEPIREIDTTCVASCGDIAICAVTSKTEDEEESDGSEYAYLDEKWNELEDVLFIENDEGILVLHEDWFCFSRGYSQEEVWAFFDKQHPDGLKHFIEG